MLRVVSLTALLTAFAAAPALADTGGLQAVTPPEVSPQGGVSDPAATPSAESAQSGEAAPAAEAPATPAPATTTTRRAAPPARASQTSGDEPLDPSPSTESAVRAEPPSDGGGLPHTGFALAALIAVGTGFFLTGYALRYSRALDG